MGTLSTKLDRADILTWAIVQSVLSTRPSAARGKSRSFVGPWTRARPASAHRRRPKLFGRARARLRPQRLSAGPTFANASWDSKQGDRSYPAEWSVLTRSSFFSARSTHSHPCSVYALLAPPSRPTGAGPRRQEDYSLLLGRAGQEGKRGSVDGALRCKSNSPARSGDSG